MNETKQNIIESAKSKVGRIFLVGLIARRLFPVYLSRDSGTQRQFLENFCSEDDLRSRIFETFVVKFLACLPLLGFSNI